MPKMTSITLFGQAGAPVDGLHQKLRLLNMVSGRQHQQDRLRNLGIGHQACYCDGRRGISPNRLQLHPPGSVA
jgi:hypothetical protein